MSSNTVFFLVCYGGRFVDGGSDYVRSTTKNIGLEIPVDICVDDLFKLILRKLPGEHSSISLCFKHPKKQYVMEILDQSDVDHFIRIATSIDDVVCLYIVDSDGTRVEPPLVIENVGKGSGSGKGSNNVVNNDRQLVIFEDPNDFVETGADEEPYYDHQTTQMCGTSFWKMPPPAPLPKQHKDPSAMWGNKETTLIKKYQHFDSKDDFKLCMGKKAISEGFQYWTYKSNPDLIVLKCTGEKCKWFVRAIRLADSEVMQIRTLDDSHSCSQTQVFPNHRQANKKVLGDLIVSLIENNPARVFRGKDIMQDINARFKIDISYKQAWRAKCHAIALLRGDPAQSFADLPVYCHNLKIRNPGTVTHIQTDNEDRFEHLFVAMGPAIRAFRLYTRPLVIVDGAHLKGHFSGTMLLAVGMDADNGILPIAYGICKSESIESWTWFFEKLHHLISDIYGLTFVSDRAPSIENAILSVFGSGVHHGFCCQHLLGNLKAKFKENDKTKGLFWRMCKAYTTATFYERFENFHKARPREYKILLDVGPHRWSRALFSGNRYNVMTSNSAESINALSRHARAMPVTMLIDFFRATMQQWFFERRTEAQANKLPVTDWADKKIQKRQKAARGCNVYPISQFEFEVRQFDVPFIANIVEKNCTCQQWQKSAIPCCHAIAVYRYLNMSDCLPGVYDWYLAETYRKTYEEYVYPLPAPNEWDRPENLMIVRPPVMDKRQPGRPKNKDRIPSQGETLSQRKCGRCGVAGHRRERCRELLPSSSRTNTQTAGTSSTQDTVDLKKF